MHSRSGGILVRGIMTIGIAMFPFSLAAQATPAPAPVTIALTHVVVIDVAGGTELRDRTVIVRDRRIVAVDSSPRAVVPSDARVVDGSGRYLIPGLWDMHVHTFYPDDIDPNFPVFIANGVTGIRDLGNSVLSLARIHELRGEVDTGRRVGPRFIAAGPLVDGRPASWPNSVIADTPERARVLVDSLSEAGSDFIKVYSRLQAGPYRAIVEESRRRGVPFAGHVPDAVSASEASDAGQRSMEHLFGVVQGCSKIEREVIAARTALLEVRADGGDTLVAARAASAANRRATQGFDEATCRALAARLARNHTWQVPTLTVFARADCITSTEMDREERVKYVSPRRQVAWPKMRAARARRNAADAELARTDSLICSGAMERLTGFLYRAGVPILAGTDAGNPYVLYGFGLHQELALLVRAGLTPLAALQAATINPAVFLGATDSLGTVALGKRADLVLLDADPLADIENTTRIRAVLADGRYYDRPALDALLAAGARASAAER